MESKLDEYTIGYLQALAYGPHFCGEGAESLLPNFKVVESHEAPPCLAPSDKILNI